MDLLLKRLIERAEKYFPRNEIISREAGGMFRYTYKEYCERTRRIASVMETLNISPGERVATLSWNTYRHLELYFAVPCSGRVLHTANLRLSDEHIAYTINHAKDKALFFSADLLPTVEAIAPMLTTVEAFVVMDDKVPETPLSPVYDYESLVDQGNPDYQYPEIPETSAASMCFTSATTGNPKGVVYSHRGMYLHALTICAVDTMAITESDTLLPIAPMFHVNAWGVPFAGVWMGAKFVFPGERPHAEDSLQLIQDEKVTFAFGAVTVGIDIMNLLKEKSFDISSLRSFMLGGQATPKTVMEFYLNNHGVPIFTAWGATECAPIATTVHIKRDQKNLSQSDQLDIRVRQGIPVPGVELEVRNEQGEVVAWDDQQVGEAYARGPWIATEYDNDVRSEDGFADGWWVSGDVATVDGEGVLRLVDRAKDLIKSGGEWISSVDIENEIMGHDSVREATVVAVPDEKWLERPVAFLVVEPGCEKLTDETLRTFLTAAGLAKWWLPDRFVYIEEIPKTGVGKFDKKMLREQLDNLIS